MLFFVRLIVILYYLVEDQQYKTNLLRRLRVCGGRGLRGVAGARAARLARVHVLGK